MMLIQLQIRGLVQGVGFRPFIYLLAKEMGIDGTVANTNNGVIIHAELSKTQLDEFVRRIWEEHPPVAGIYHIETLEQPDGNATYTGFSILKSLSNSDETTQVAPDIAVCEQCMGDRKTQSHRKDYPFINCTHCGPRFSIVRDLPYDRNRTTMSDFAMCPDCQKEYADIVNRRFHAQPVACNHCGPFYYTTYQQKVHTNYRKILELSIALLNDGKVIAVKGIGGYHLVCDACNEAAVNRLREIKARDTKPFAVMFNDTSSMLPFVHLNEIEKENLISWRRPIVLLQQQKTETALAKAVNPGMRTLGCMLPSMPLHFDWFEGLYSPVLVMTSGNLSDLPIAVSPEDADAQFGDKVELILHHNRPIHNRVDDSVLQVSGDLTCLIRRSRGYAPEVFFADIPTEGILAFGAEKVNVFALGKGDTVIQSQYIGDLKNAETFHFYTESIERFQRLFRFTPRQLVCDLHPDYLSTQYAEEMSAKQIPLLKVQHHHAHAAACMLEYGLHQPVIAVVWDGTGLGDDGTAWGGEFFVCDRKQYSRVSHLEYVLMPGGDKASLEPWRMAVACLHHCQIPLPASFTERIGKEKTDRIMALINKKLNAPLTSSAGRLFDAVASLLGVCDTATRQAEAPILLEQLAAENCKCRYSTDVSAHPVSVRPIIQGILTDMQNAVAVEIITAKFHNALADLLVQKVRQMSAQFGITQAVLSGGCFQNKRLTEEICRQMAKEPLTLYLPAKIPCNDSGIAAGQLAIAAARNMNQSITNNP